MSSEPNSPEAAVDGFGEAVARLSADPGRSAILCDIDGTLAPITQRPEDARVDPAARDALRVLAEHFALVAGVSGRQTTQGRAMVGLGEIAYAGNHGFELLPPGATEPHVHPRVAARAELVPEFLATLDHDELAAAGVRFEDKGPIQALHWRGAEDEEAAATAVDRVAAAAHGAGLFTHSGRKVLELRPVEGIDKGSAVRALIETNVPVPTAVALYAGDDRTDLDGFRGLRELVAESNLEAAVCIGVRSAEGPAEIVAGADLVVDGTGGVTALLIAIAAAVSA